MTGLILCGGDSTRMGTDKGLISKDTKTWTALAIEKLTSLGIPIFISINDRQLLSYTWIFPRRQLVPDDPTLSLKGPLAGLLSVHLKVLAEDLFVLACDLPQMDPTLLQGLYSRQIESPDAQAYVYSSDDNPEPLCGIYTAAGLDRLTTLYRAGNLRRHSMKYALDQLTVDFLPIPEEKQKCFENFNYPSGPDQQLPADAS